MGLTKKTRDDADKHKCTLPPQEDIMVKYISGGYCVEFRRMLKRITMVSERNPRSKMYLKSTYNIRWEKIRHLEDHYYMIHPFSDLKSCWEFFMILVLIVSMVIVPVLLCMQEISMPMLYFRVALDLCCLTDILIIFNCGYQESKTKKVILNRKRVAVNYLKTWFTTDFLSLPNMDIILLLMEGTEAKEKYWMIKFLNVTKILRIFTLMIYMNRFREYFHLSLFRFKIFKLISVMILLLLWASCILYILARESNETWLGDLDENFTLNLMQSFLKIFNFFLLIYHYPPSSLTIVMFELTALAVGVVLNLFFLSQFMQAVEKHNTSANKYNDKNQQLHSYMQNKQIPKSLVKRAQSFFDFKFQKSYYRESELIQTLSSKLREEINYHICQKLLENVNILKDVPMKVVMTLTTLMEEEIYLPNDVITKDGDVGDCMYFISSGMVAVYTAGGKEVAHITNGGNFGEACLTMGHSSRIGTIVAVDYCDLYVLSRRNFQLATKMSPDLYEKAVAISKMRMEQVVMAEHTKSRPPEFYDLKTPEGVYYFRQSLYDL